MQIIVYKDID